MSSPKENAELIYSRRTEDFEITYFSGTGAGGQHRNKHMNCVRIKDKETGLMASCAEHRSLPQNKKTAFRRMITLLNNHYCPSISKERYPSQTTIRTYHEPDDRVIDHETKKRYSFRKTVGKNDLSEVIEDRIYDKITNEDNER